MADRKSTIYDLEAEKIKEKIIIFAADTGGYTQKEVSLEIQASLDELTELIDTAGAEVVGRLVQNRTALQMTCIWEEERLRSSGDDI